MALRPFSQMNPRTRRERLLAFNDRIQTSSENDKIKEEWGLEIQRDLVKVNAYCINAEMLTFGEDEMKENNTLRYVTLFLMIKHYQHKI